jgi:hypothetical protein
MQGQSTFFAAFFQPTFPIYNSLSGSLIQDPYHNACALKARPKMTGEF